MTNADPDWWVIFACISLSGLFGGLTRFFLDWYLADDDGATGSGENSATKLLGASPSWATFFGNLIVGVTGAFLVPLFLNSISSTLLETSTVEAHQPKLFILIGFCLAASVFAKQFIPTVGAKALRIAGEAKEESDEAKKESDEAKKESEGAMASAVEAQSAAEEARQTAKDAVNGAQEAIKLAEKVYQRTVALVRPVQAIQTGDFDQAIEQLLRVVAADRGNAEAMAWLAYCYKRKNDCAAAVKAISEALAAAERPIFTWVYNLACYKELSGAAVEEVIEVLKQAVSVASPEQLATLQQDLRHEEDFASLRQRSQLFNDFVESLQSN